MENGPLLANPDGTVSLNPFSWNQFANTLYGTLLVVLHGGWHRAVMERLSW